MAGETKPERKKIVIFPGNVREYEEFVGYQVEIMNTGSINK